MKKLLLVVLFGLCCTSTIAYSEFAAQLMEGKYDVNTLFPNGSGSLYHKNGQLRAKWSTKTGAIEEGFYDENGNIVKDGPYRYYYGNGQLSEEGMIKNGKPDGLWKAYYPSGVLQSESSFKNGISGYGISKLYYENGKIAMEMESEGYMITDGKVTAYFKHYYPNGQLKQEFFIKDNVSDGLEKEYDERGNLIAEQIWRNGKKEGISTYYYEDGSKEEIPYVNDVHNGLSKLYHPNGQLAAESYVIDGVQEGLMKNYYPDGALMAEGYVKKGKPDGIIKQYYPSGKLLQLITLKEGILDGVSKEYYEDGKIRFEAIYQNGDGKGKEYYENGKIKSEITYKNGQRNGPMKSYDEEGKLISVQEYKEGEPLE